MPCFLNHWLTSFDWLDPKYYDLIVEKDGVGTLTTLMGDILKLDFSAKLVSEVIDGYIVMLEHGSFLN